jgi:hypothetical protein
MTASKVACPQCHAVLRLTMPVPEGAAVQCPQCRFGFRVAAPANKGPGSSPLSDTCFALLFLQRINLAKDLTDKLNEMQAAVLSSNNPPRKE